MTIKELVSEIALREAGKSNVKVGDIREIIGHLSDILHSLEHDELEYLLDGLEENAKRRAKRKKK